MDVYRSRKSLHVIVFVSAMLMPYLTGFLGLMPLDQSIIFEAAGRMLHGQWPFRDFFLPYGLMPSIMQVAFFKLMGINWFAYVTHAALMNGCFTLLFLDCLVILHPDISRKKLAAGALLAAWSFYPMTGTPFLENHSLFFALLAYWLVLSGLNRKKYYLLIFSLPSMVPAFYSKPIPVVFWMLPIVYECWLHRKHFREFFIPLFSGLLVAAALMLVPFLVFPADALYYYTIRLPLQLGRGRVEGTFFSRLIKSSIYFKMVFLSLIPFFFYFFSYKKSKDLPGITRALLFVGISVLFGVLTKNSFYNVTTPILIFSFLIFHFILLQQGCRQQLVRVYSRLNFVTWILFIVLISIINFRRTMDIQFRPKDLAHYSSELNIFVKTPLGRHSREDVEKLKNLIVSKDVLYTGDMQFLFSLSGRYNPLPLTHINDHTTYESKDTICYNKLKQQLIQNLIRNKTTMLIEEESMYNPDQALVVYIAQMKGRQVDSFAGIKVYTIDTAKMYQLASSLNIRRER